MIVDYVNRALKTDFRVRYTIQQVVMANALMTLGLGLAFLVVYLGYGLIVNPMVWFVGSWAIWIFCSCGGVKWMSEGGDLGPGLKWAFIQVGFSACMIVAFKASEHMKDNNSAKLVGTVCMLIAIGIIYQYLIFTGGLYGFTYESVWPKEHYSRGTLRHS